MFTVTPLQSTSSNTTDSTSSPSLSTSTASAKPNLVLVGAYLYNVGNVVEQCKRKVFEDGRTSGRVLTDVLKIE